MASFNKKRPLRKFRGKARRKETLNDFLARGGTITECPPQKSPDKAYYRRALPSAHTRNSRTGTGRVSCKAVGGYHD